jgi:hypothetical protein
MMIRTPGGRRDLVVPATLLKVGRFVGSAGPVDYSADLLRECAGRWAGKAVTDGHPLDRDGKPVPAGSRAAVSGPIIGRLANVTFCEATGRLLGQLVLDPNKASRHAPGLNYAVRSKRPIDVSTGLELTLDAAGVPLKINPDHLAILRHTPAACSVRDGCGVGV